MNENLLINRFFKNNPKSFGNFLALIGVLILTPDTMVMRFSNLDRWPLMGWRGVLMGISLLIIWRLFLFSYAEKKWSTIFTWQGLIVIIAFSINSITFTLGIQETSVMVVLTALATMPLFAAILSSFMMNEAQGRTGWLTVTATVLMSISNLPGRKAGSGPPIPYLYLIRSLTAGFQLPTTSTRKPRPPSATPWISRRPLCAETWKTLIFTRDFSRRHGSVLRSVMSPGRPLTW